MRRGVRQLLESATAPDGDVRLPDDTAIEVCRAIGSSMPQPESLMLTSFNDDEVLFDAIMVGAPGYCSEEVADQS